MTVIALQSVRSWIFNPWFYVLLVTGASLQCMGLMSRIVTFGSFAWIYVRDRYIKPRLLDSHNAAG